MKIRCSICRENLPVDEFSRNKHITRGYSYPCKVCAKERRTELRLENEHHLIVYYLPKENYCGVTKNLKDRIAEHKSKGRDTTGYKVMFSSEDAIEVLHMEAMYHSVLGMHGLNKTNNAYTL